MILVLMWHAIFLIFPNFIKSVVAMSMPFCRYKNKKKSDMILICGKKN